MDASSSAATFATTHWSAVLAAGHGAPAEALNALEQLARTYQYPIYAEVRRQGHDHHAALDLTQAFFAKLLAGSFFARAESAKGRFRNYLLTALNHFLADEWRHRTREGMRFVSGAPWKHSGRSCRTDGNEVTIRPGGKLNQQVGLREMLENHAWR